MIIIITITIIFYRTDIINYFDFENNLWKPIDEYANNGFLASFIKQSKNLFNEKPENYSVENLKNITDNEIYFVNSESNFVKNFIDEFDDRDKSKIIHFLEILSSMVPYDDIYNSMCNKALAQKISQDGIDSIVIEGVNQFNYLKKLLQLPNEKIFEVLRTYEPFDNEEIFKLVEERIKNEK
jgi:hypothetical protein